jgi:hypothetical protein
VNQNLHGRIDERDVNGRPPEDRVPLATDAKANKPLAGRISTGRKLGARIQ